MPLVAKPMQLTLFFIGTSNTPWRNKFRPYRLMVFCRIPQYKRTKREVKKTVREYGYVAWNSDNSHEPGRLNGSGSFLFPGLESARRSAMAELAKPEVVQVSVRTNQDRTIYTYHKHQDGRITGYGI